MFVDFRRDLHTGEFVLPQKFFSHASRFFSKISRSRLRIVKGV